MHKVDLLEQALRAARDLGYEVRQEWLDGAGGACLLGGRKLLFVDLSLDTSEQLHQVLDAIAGDASSPQPTLSMELARHVASRRASERRKAA